MRIVAAVISCLLLTGFSAHAGMIGWTSSNYLRRASQVINTYPFLISVWVNMDDINFGTYRTAASSGVSGETNQRRGYVGIADDWIFSLACDAVACGEAFPSVLAPLDTWFHITGEFISTSSRATLAHGSNRGSNATTVTPPASDSFAIGVGTHLGEPMASTDAVAEVSVWNCCSTSSEMDQLSGLLATGQNPINIKNQVGQPWSNTLVAYWPMATTADLADASGNGHTMTLTGSLSNSATHPTIEPIGGSGGGGGGVFFPRRRIP